jgi:membrane associated rhomboid family serine protease
MRPRLRRSFGSFTSVRSAAVRLAIALLVGSVVFALAPREVGAALLLSPGLTLGRLWVWQPLTYGFVEDNGLGIIFGALVLWQIGGALEQTWGPRRMVTFALVTTVIAGLLTVALSLVVAPLAAMQFTGGWVMASALWVAYGLSLGRAQTGFWGLPVTGNVLAAIGAGFVFLNGALTARSAGSVLGWLVVLPAALAMLLALGYVRGDRPEHWWLRFQSWRLQRRLRGRSKHLKVVASDRNTSRDSDRFLH